MGKGVKICVIKFYFRAAAAVAQGFLAGKCWVLRDGRRCRWHMVHWLISSARDSILESFGSNIKARGTRPKPFIARNTFAGVTRLSKTNPLTAVKLATQIANIRTHTVYICIICAKIKESYFNAGPKLQPPPGIHLFRLVLRPSSATCFVSLFCDSMAGRQCAFISTHPNAPHPADTFVAIWWQHHHPHPHPHLIHIHIPVPHPPASSYTQ